MAGLVRIISMNSSLFPELVMGSLSASDCLYMEWREADAFELALQEQERQQQAFNQPVRKPLTQFPYGLGVD